MDTRACPACLAADVAAHAGPPDQAAYCRMSWLVGQIRACPTHAVELVGLPTADADLAGGRSALHDFVGRLASALHGAAKLPVRPTYVSGLEAYLHRRLGGAAGDAWLDGLPFNVVATFTEHLGVAALHGADVRFGELGSLDWKAAGDAGWQVMCLGERGIRDFAAVMSRDPDRGFRDMFGEFWPFVMRASRKPRYRDLCRALTSRLGTLHPALPRRLAEGAPAGEVRLSAASAEYRRNTGTLRRVLSGRGLLGPEHGRVAARRIVLDRAGVDAAMQELGDRMSLAECGRYLNAPGRQPGLLYSAGLLGAVAPGRRQGANLTVSRGASDDLLRDLTKGAVDRRQPSSGEGTLMQAARSARRPFADVARLVVEGRLAWVGRQVDVAGVSGVLVRLEEVRQVLNDGEAVGPTRQEASRILRIAHPGIVALVRDGRLTMVTVRQRRTSQPYEVVTPGSLAAFRREYVSVSLVGLEWGVHPHAARARLRQGGILPAFPVPTYGTPIFRTRDIHPGPASVRAT